MPLSVFVCHPERSEGPRRTPHHPQPPVPFSQQTPAFPVVCFSPPPALNYPLRSASCPASSSPSHSSPSPRRSAPSRPTPPSPRPRSTRSASTATIPPTASFSSSSSSTSAPRRLHDLYAHPRRPGREQDTHDLIQQFTSIADQLSDNLDDYGPRHVDLRRALPKILTAIARWSAALNALPDNDAYTVTRQPRPRVPARPPRIHHPARRRSGRLVQGPSPQQIPQRQKRPHRHPPLTG